MNKIEISGRLIRDPEIKTDTKDKKQVRITLAVKKNINQKTKKEMEKKGQPTADLINIIAWNKHAENLLKYTKKGTKISVKGFLQTGIFINEYKKKINTTSVVLQELTFLD